MTIDERLVSEGRTRWLDIGIGASPAEPNFQYVDILPKQKVHESVRPRYSILNIATASSENLKKLGQFDLVRLQHVLEHLSFEDGYIALKNCARLLKPDGYIIITVPNLRIHVERYLKNDYRDWSSGWVGWALRRIPADAPASMMFSMFAHSTLSEPHLWCYDADGVIYQLSRTGRFKEIKELPVNSPLAKKPFTHNRPSEDVCVIARKK